MPIKTPSLPDPTTKTSSSPVICLIASCFFPLSIGDPSCTPHPTTLHHFQPLPMAASFLSHAATLALRVSFGRAMQQHVPAFFLHGPATTPARSHRLLDAAIGVLVDTVIGLLRIALWAAFLAVVLAVSLLVLLLILFASCAAATLVAIVVHLDRARESGSRERRLAVLAFISVFLLTVALVLMLVVILAAVDGEE